MQELKHRIETLWEKKDTLTPRAIAKDERQAIENTLDLLDKGKIRVAEKISGTWTVNEWIKKAILLFFKTSENEVVEGTFANFFDKVPLKYRNAGAEEFQLGKARVVPPAIVRRGAFIAPGAVLMPSFVNVGAYVGEGTMIDTWATVGSCAQIGKHCHISGGAGIGGVLEPLQAEPVIIEDLCFIGARSEVAEGAIVREGSVLAMGVFIGASTRIVDRATGETFLGEVPAYSVVVPGAMPGKPMRDGMPGPALSCA